MKNAALTIFILMLAFTFSGPTWADNSFKVPVVSTDLLKSYNHKNPSGHFADSCKINRLGNFGIDTRQVRSPINWDLLADRDYLQIGETSDEGWLVGGGEDAKLKRKDTGHAEVWRIGPNSYAQGGFPYQTAIEVMRNIQFAPLYLRPLRVEQTGGGDLELLFAYEPQSNIGQLFQTLTSLLKCPCGDYGNPFHVTMVRGVKFRSEEARNQYFKNAETVISGWQKQYPDGILFGNGGISFFLNREEIVEEFLPTLTEGVTVDLEALKMISDYPQP